MYGVPGQDGRVRLPQRRFDRIGLRKIDAGLTIVGKVSARLRQDRNTIRERLTPECGISLERAYCVA